MSGNLSNGYLFGGSPNDQIISKINYVTDTLSPVPSMALQKRNQGAVSGRNNGMGSPNIV